MDDEDLTDEHRKVLQESAKFYSTLLLSRKYEFDKVITYLGKRCVGEDTIRKYNIGFCPRLKDEKYEGRALLNQYFERFTDDLTLYQCFQRAGLFRLLDEAHIYYRKFIDFRPSERMESRPLGAVLRTGIHKGYSAQIN